MGNRASLKNNQDQAKRDTITSIIFLSLVVIGILIAILYSSGVSIFIFLSSGERKISMDTGKVVKGVTELTPDITENSDIAPKNMTSIASTQVEAMELLKNCTGLFQLSDQFSGLKWSNF